jgi:4-aminobutyrate aminotransferase-like enzyme
MGEVVSDAAPIAGFLVESMLSCAGQIPLPPGYLTAVFEHVRAAGGLCIADEVQVGFGRVGSHMWAFEEHGVVPDIVVMGKPMGNGHPMAAVFTTPAIAASFEEMEFFSTFGGNPVSCAIGMAVLDTIEEDGLMQRATELGERFMVGLRELQERYPIIGDVRGRGLFLGFELVRDRETQEPATEEAARLVDEMCARNVLLSTDGPLHNVIKIKPPMVLSKGDVDTTLSLLNESLSQSL